MAGPTGEVCQVCVAADFLEAARARGWKGGRKPVTVDDPQVHMVEKMHADKTVPIVDICQTLRISRATLYRYLAMK